MKRLSVLLAMLLLAVPAFAAPEAMNELSLEGQFVQGDEGADDVWTLAAAQTFAIGKGGYFLFGPEIGIGEDNEQNRLGARLDVNIFGTGAFTLYGGGSILYFVKHRDEGPQHSAAVRGGAKIAVGKGAAIDLSAMQIVDGVGEDVTDRIVSAGIIARWK